MCPWCLAPNSLFDSDPTLQLDGRLNTQAKATTAMIFIEFGVAVVVVFILFIFKQMFPLGYF